MQITLPEKVTQSEPLRFSGSRGERLSIDVLDHDLIRVCHRPDGQARLDRTWMVLGKDGEMPLAGRSRDDLSGFALPPYQVESSGDQLEVRTDKLQIKVQLGDFRLEWFDTDGQRFAADLKHRAYPYDRSGQAVYHYLERRIDEHYYGFGERAGSLDKYGMRFIMKNLDALGYSAATSDPLYKHFPFYITYVPELKIAYGLFYDDLATTVFDLGKENDAFWGFYRYYMAEAGDIDYTMIYGPTIEAVVEKFTALTGRTVSAAALVAGLSGIDHELYRSARRAGAAQALRRSVQGTRNPVRDVPPIERFRHRRDRTALRVHVKSAAHPRSQSDDPAFPRRRNPTGGQYQAASAEGSPAVRMAASQRRLDQGILSRMRPRRAGSGAAARREAGEGGLRRFHQ